MIKFGRITSPVGNIINEINKTKKMNFDYVELCIEPLTDYIYLNKNKKTIKKLLKNFFHKPIAHTAWWYDLSSPYELIRKAWIKQAERDIKIASKIGAKSLNFHFMVHSKILLEYNKPRQIILSNYVKSLRYISDFAQRYKVMIMLENVEEKFDYYKYILDRTPKLNVHLDVGHAFISGGMKNIRKFISYFDGRIAHIMFMTIMEIKMNT